MTTVTIANARPYPTEPDDRPEEEFEQQAPRVVRQLRAALSTLIEAIPGDEPIRKGADLERALDIPVTLAWKVFSVSQANEPMAQVGNIPGASAMKRFFDAAAKQRAPGSLLNSARVAFAEFDELVRVHAGSRTALDSMINGLKDEGSDQMDLQQKRAAFKAYSHIWGVQAQTQLSCFIFRPSESDPSLLDMLGIRGLVGLRRLRRDASWVVTHARMADDDCQIRRPLNRTPIDPIDHGSQGVSLLKEFCSQPLPKFRSVPTESGFVNVELEPTNVGNRSAVTCLLGDVYGNVFSRYHDEHNRVQSTQSMVRTPCEVLIHDVLVEAGTYDSILPKVSVYGDHRDTDPAVTGRECDLLALRESVTYLGHGPAVMRTADVPRYPEMVRHAIERSGWDPDAFDVWRCRVEYPVMPSSVVVQFDLPEKLAR